MNAKDAEAGVWYQHEKYGKVLCCGAISSDHFIGFVVREPVGGTALRYLMDENFITKSLNQSWGPEPEPLRPSLESPQRRTSTKQ